MLTGPKSTQRKARALRRQLTLPEVMLWQQLRQSPAGLRFRRQHPAGPYVLDFYCAIRLLAIEVDGAVHDLEAQWQHDLARDSWLVGQGIMVMRVPAREVLVDCGAVVDRIVVTALALVDIRAR
ncbi:endonuclease domain-containing protein [Sandarakinorhabdus sp.]|jgi:very-short-patch-repair endonuclease|uniref:endonuclease domain-containing protein n=1 Tax=Sandarakinorhabdus sp. TaxID=1916663 RepID=UPI003341C07C